MEKKNFDPTQWVNAGSESELPKKTAASVSNPASDSLALADNELEKARAVCNELLQHGANIAESQDDYYRLIEAMVDLGDDGKELCRQLCQQSAKYQESDFEYQWKWATNNKKRSIHIATFYEMAKSYGVDLSAISRQYPSADFTSKPQFPHSSVEKYTNQGNCALGNSQSVNNQNNNNNNSSSYTARATGADSGEDIEVLRFSFSQTFSQHIDKNRLPVTIQRTLEGKESFEEQDKTILADLDLLAIAEPNVYGIYGDKRVYTPFYLFILGPAGISQKGSIDDIKHLLTPIERSLRASYYQQLADYKEQHAAWEARKSQRGKSREEAGAEPEEPIYRSLFVSADSSSAAFKSDLHSFGGRGMIFTTEADTLTQALAQEWGAWTDALRQAFHHETITSTRVRDKQHIVIDEPQLGMLVTCTPKQITYLLSPKQNENGTSSRDLFYCSKENLEWRDPFRGKEPLGDRYQEIGITIKQMYDLLICRKEKRIQILLTEEQQQAFNNHFKPLLPEQVGLYGVEFAAFVVRIALVAFRMMMVLTTLRNFEQGNLADTQQQAFVCTDDDYQTAMTIIDCLVRHTAYVYSTLLRPSDDPQLTIQPMKAKESQLYMALPDDFVTKQFEQTAKELSIPLKSAQRYLGNLISRYQLVEHTSHGHYAKIKSTGI